MCEHELPNGRADHRPAVQALLRHLADAGFDGAPAPDGTLPGEPLGKQRPWPGWVHDDETLWQVAQWLREYHAAVADFVPPAGATWRKGGTWEPGLIIGHNDATPGKVAVAGGRVAGFSGWEFAGPVTAEADLAFAAFAWVPLTARQVAEADGFTAFADRPRRLRLFLDAYGWRGTLRQIVREVRDRISASIHDIRRLAADGDADCREMLDAGHDRELAAAVRELAQFPR
ncbi:aminoglycoside phosphotransferase family protein [Actinoplanes sp. NPDC024001]|uniref:aminoglycoside phosphotransferase family protein n=1 Tax=Actinoplanes sp. NPDC024001 TaxID=3154598 RepID=UPI0033BFD7B4